MKLREYGDMAQPIFKTILAQGEPLFDSSADEWQAMKHRQENRECAVATSREGYFFAGKESPGNCRDGRILADSLDCELTEHEEYHETHGDTISVRELAIKAPDEGVFTCKCGEMKFDIIFTQMSTHEFITALSKNI